MTAASYKPLCAVCRQESDSPIHTLSMAGERHQFVDPRSQATNNVGVLNVGLMTAMESLQAERDAALALAEERLQKFASAMSLIEQIVASLPGEDKDWLTKPIEDRIAKDNAMLKAIRNLP